MRIIALEQECPGATPGRFRALAQAEAARAWQLYQEGILRELYFRADRSEAVLILECEDVETARQHLGTLPLVQAGLITFELILLAPYPGFARLFEAQYQVNESH